MLFDISGDHCMFDLETMDNVPGGAIMSIGAVTFNVDGVLPNSDFYTVISIGSCQANGLVVNKETEEWWEKQPEEARAVIRESKYGKADNLIFGLGKFSHYLDRFKPTGMWGNGSDFDNAFLQVAHRKAGLPAPYDFRNSRCFRTLRKVCGGEVDKPDETGVHHNALDDARYQAHYAVSIFQKLRSLNESQ
jgi:3' exoribonuclease, RNase T-like